jgi:hypothetical protein
MYGLIFSPLGFTKKCKIKLLCLLPVSMLFLFEVPVDCSNTRSIRDDTYWTSRENSLELIELSSINKVSLV